MSKHLFQETLAELVLVACIKLEHTQEPIYPGRFIRELADRLKPAQVMSLFNRLVENYHLEPTGSYHQPGWTPTYRVTETGRIHAENFLEESWKLAVSVMEKKPGSSWSLGLHV